jgi:hypothetical protein
MKRTAVSCAPVGGIDAAAGDRHRNGTDPNRRNTAGWLRFPRCRSPRADPAHGIAVAIWGCRGMQCGFSIPPIADEKLNGMGADSRAHSRTNGRERGRNRRHGHRKDGEERSLLDESEAAWGLMETLRGEREALGGIGGGEGNAGPQEESQ